MTIPTRALQILTLPALLVLAAGDAAAQRVREEPAKDGRAFQIYDTQAVRSRVASATEHIGAERWSEALVDLQILLEEHWGEVLPGERDEAGLRGPAHPVHRGAGDWAATRLWTLPEEARELYRERYGKRAARALEAAVAGGSRRSLVDVARRWPATDEAVHAWWALGDLELEQGDVEACLTAWGRAVRRGLADPTLVLDGAEQWRAALEGLRAAGRARPGDGRADRIELAAAHLEGSLLGQAAERAPDATTALRPGGVAPRLGRDVDRWPHPFPLGGAGGFHPEEEHPFLLDSKGRYALYPARSGNHIVYSTTRSLVVVEAFTGEVVWRTPPGWLGWDQVANGPIQSVGAFDKAIEFQESLVQPAVAQGVVVAPLQIPVAYEREDNYGDLEIIRVVPERRLFAFDAADGTPLWDTLPPADWDGESGSFAERMTIVGSPTVVGSRLIAPAARVRGRIELFLGCFDLHTGEVLWSTPLVTGQRPLNMFGRQVSEYAAPPPVVAGERVVFATQLGTVACLDLFTGETQWQSLYDQIQIIPGTYYEPGTLDSVWRNSPPAVTGDVVVATPLDGRELLGYDLNDGAVLWSLSHAELCASLGDPYARVRFLMGADDKRVVLGGNKIAAFEASGGLRRGPPRRRAWVYPGSTRFPPSSPRPVLTRDRVVVPQSKGIQILDRRNGRSVDEIAGTTQGNVLVGDGMLFTLSVYSLNGYLQWEAMLTRAREQLLSAPDDPEAVEGLARLLLMRGLSATARSEYREAKRHLEQAREVVEDLGLGDGLETLPSLRRCMHEVLRAEGRNARLGADARLALASLRRARALAPDPRARRDVLLEEAELLRGRETGEWQGVLSLLYDELAALPMQVVAVAGPVEHAPWSRLQPVAARLATDPGEDAFELPVGLWVLIERSLYFADRGQREPGREFADLHAILHRYGDHPLLKDSAGEWASARIADKLARGDRRGYEPFAQRADELLREARAGGSVHLFERIGRLFPHSEAAAQASDERVELYLAAGAVDRAAQVVIDELSPGWTPADSSERETRRLMRLAELFGAGGNPTLRGTLTRSLARHHPHLEITLTDGRRVRLIDLDRAWSEGAAAEPAPYRFGPGLIEGRRFPCATPFEPVGEVPPGEDGSPGRVSLVCDGWTLLAFAEGAAPEPIWSQAFGDPRARGADRDPLPAGEFDSHVRTSPGRVHVATLRRVRTFGREDGAVQWVWEAGPGIDGIEAGEGIVLVHQDLGLEDPAQDTSRLVALEAATGLVLWEHEVAPENGHRRALIGSESVVLLPHRSTGTGVVLDAVTGREVARIPLPRLQFRTAAHAWIENGRLILPHFGRPRHGDVEGNGLVAYDLSSGERAWRVGLDDLSGMDWELMEVFSWEDSTTLLLVPLRNDTRTEPGLFALDTKLGALATAPRAEVPGARLIGYGKKHRTRLASPYLFNLERPSERDGPHVVTAIHVTWGERWRARLEPGVLYNAYDMDPPAVSDSTVALAHVRHDPSAGGRARRPGLVLLDKATGRHLGRVELPTELYATTARLRLAPLGEGLFVCGARLMQWMR